MSNEETLQEYNGRLEENNVSLANVLETINNLPSSSGGSSSDIYSTEETIVGTWIDGRPLYRKVVIIDDIGDAGNLHIPYNIDNADIVWVDGSASFVTNNMETLPASCHYGGNDWIRSWVSLRNKNIRVRTLANLTGYAGYITLLYTKTTD